MAGNRGKKAKLEQSVHEKSGKPMIVADPSHMALPVQGLPDVIGEKLRAYYEHVASEPVPDRFAALLAQLEAKSVSKK
jgi:Anti-sigma factor NepR